jgi:hypothetical protein
MNVIDEEGYTTRVRVVYRRDIVKYITSIYLCTID